MDNISAFNKAIYILQVIENENDATNSIANLDTKWQEILKLLEEMDLTKIIEGNHKLTDKGKSVLYYFNKLNLDNNPLILNR